LRPQCMILVVQLCMQIANLSRLRIPLEKWKNGSGNRDLLVEICSAHRSMIDTVTCVYYILATPSTCTCTDSAIPAVPCWVGMLQIQRLSALLLLLLFLLLLLLFRFGVTPLLLPLSLRLLLHQLFRLLIRIHLALAYALASRYTLSCVPELYAHTALLYTAYAQQGSAQSRRN
jgi:hypothetical protein